MSDAFFTPPHWDDADLTPTEFRVFAHISRRAGGAVGDGEAWSSRETMAKICRMHPDTLGRAIKELLRRKMISAQPRPGYTTYYRVNPMADWLPLGNEGAPLENQGAEDKGHQPLTLEGHLPPETKGYHPPEDKGHKGYPLKETQEGDPSKETQSIETGEELTLASALETPQPTKVTAEMIYEAYPRKVERKDALKAISKAMKENSPARLLSCTKAYAEAVHEWRKEDRQYIPYPASWFNKGCFDDDQTAWVRSYSTSSTGGHPFQMKAATQEDHAKGFWPTEDEPRRRSNSGGHPFQLKKSDHSKGF